MVDGTRTERYGRLTVNVEADQYFRGLTVKLLHVLSVTALAVAPLNAAGSADIESLNQSTAVMSHEGRAQLSDQVSSVAYSDFEIAQFLVLGEGPVASDNPELPGKLGFDKTPDEVNRAGMQELIHSYLRTHPEFHTEVAEPIQSGDPRRVSPALERFAISFDEYANKVFTEAVEAGPDNTPNWAYTEVWLAAAAVVAAAGAAVVYGTVGGFQHYLAVTVLMYVYLPGNDDGTFTSLEREDIVQSVTTSLASAAQE